MDPTRETLRLYAYQGEKILCLQKSVKWEIFTRSKKKKISLLKLVKWDFFIHLKKIYWHQFFIGKQTWVKNVRKKNIILTEVSKMRFLHSLKKKIYWHQNFIGRQTWVKNVRKASPFWLKITKIQLVYNFKRWHLGCHLGVIRWHFELKGDTLKFCLKILIFIGQQYFTYWSL